MARRPLSPRLQQRLSTLTAQIGSEKAGRYLRKKIVIIGDRVFTQKVSAKKQAQAFAPKFASGFEKAVRSWPDLVDGRIEQVVTEVAARAFDNVIERTPVLSGAARAGWFMHANGRFQRFIGNNEPHIRRLEHGWSKQPNRWYMVRATLKRLPGWIEQAARRIADADAPIRTAIAERLRNRAA